MLRTENTTSSLKLKSRIRQAGNIRELQNVIERSIILSSADVFSVDELWLSKRTSSQASRVETPPALNVEARTEREIIETARWLRPRAGFPDHRVRG
jgi:transcriptional regulator with AAA-type ATPase domain